MRSLITCLILTLILAGCATDQGAPAPQPEAGAKKNRFGEPQQPTPPPPPTRDAGLRNY